MGRSVQKKAAAQRRERLERRPAPEAAAPPSPKPEGPAGLHISVLGPETVEFFPLRDGAVYLDGTLGLGGHASLLLERLKAAGIANARVIGLDRDARALDLARERLSPYGDMVVTAQAKFSEFAGVLDELGIAELDGALVDLGVSSLQLDTPERGFSFFHDGPLDMRMNPDMGQSAETLVNKASRDRLRTIIAEYGEDPMAAKIAAAIEDARSRAPITGTLELARIVENAYPPKWRATARNHPATRTFQALRIAVNEELRELEEFLEGIVARLRTGGRVAAITFHSLEDRMDKHFFRDRATACACPPGQAVCRCGHKPSLRMITKKALEPTRTEVAANPRSSCAKLRVAEKL